MAFQITGVSIVGSIVCSGTDQRKFQSSASLAFVREIHRWPVVPLKRQITRKMFPFDDVIIILVTGFVSSHCAMRLLPWSKLLDCIDYAVGMLVLWFYVIPVRYWWLTFYTMGGRVMSLSTVLTKDESHTHGEWGKKVARQFKLSFYKIMAYGLFGTRL